MVSRFNRGDIAWLGNTKVVIVRKSGNEYLVKYPTVMGWVRGYAEAFALRPDERDGKPDDNQEGETDG